MSQPQKAQSNGLGVAGFVTSLVGLVMCGGLISPIGLALSFFALFKRPRGFAVAGFIIGLIGSAWLLIALVVLILGVGLAAIGALGAGALEVTSDSIVIRTSVLKYHRNNGSLPSTLGLLSLDAKTLTDPWGQLYRYEIDPDGLGFTVSTAGPDGSWDTSDDYDVEVSVSP